MMTAKTFAASACIVLTAFGTLLGATLRRTDIDRPDDLQTLQIHLMYVLPQGASDNELDKGEIQNSVKSTQKWLKKETGNRSLRFDTYQGELDVTFRRLSRTVDELNNSGDLVRQVEYELWAEGFNFPNKLYLVYFGGSLPGSCAAASPSPKGRFALLTPGVRNSAVENGRCNELNPPKDQLYEWEATLVHEIFHLLGAVDPHAPNHASNGHVTGNERDLMNKPHWKLPVRIDINRTDYYGHGRCGLLDVSRSGFFDPPSPNPETPPIWPLHNAVPEKPGNANSPSSNVDALIEIVNLSGAVRTVCWLDSQGQLQQCQRVKAYGVYERDTFEGHLFIVQNASGNRLLLFEAAAPASRGIINK